jgi:hypothetical protein
MSTKRVSTAPKVAARPRSLISTAVRPAAEALLEPVGKFAQLVGIEVAKDLAGGFAELGVGYGLGAARQRAVGQVGVGVDRAEDPVDRLGRRQEQRHVLAAQRQPTSLQRL